MLFGDNREVDNVTGRVIDGDDVIEGGDGFKIQGDTVPNSGCGLREIGTVSP